MVIGKEAVTHVDGGEALSDCLICSLLVFSNEG